MTRTPDFGPFDQPVPVGFRVTHIACVPCGARLDVERSGADAIMRFVSVHRTHVEDYVETYTFKKPAWRGSWRR